MRRAHKIKLIPNNKQVTYFKKACGCKRLAYNWGLQQWNAKQTDGGIPSAFALSTKFNSIKKEKFPFVYEVTKCACARAFIDLEQAVKRFFEKIGSYPRFKKKGVKDSFYIGAQYIKIDGGKIKIPKLGWVKMTEELRFAGKILSVTISRTADKWFASINVEMPDVECSDNQVRSAVGIDVGISKLATLSDGTVFENPKVTKYYARKLRRLNKSLTRKKLGSSNWKKAKIRLSKLHYKINCVRQDSTHKMTTCVTKKYSDVCLEDLNVKGMVKNRHLAKSISDAGFGEIRRQFEYKATQVHFVDRFFPSSKTCSSCGQIHNMPLSKRMMECDCGFSCDRDLNAAINILRVGCPEVKLVESGQLWLVDV